MIIPVFLGIGTIILGGVNRRYKDRSSILLTLASRNMTPCPQIVNSYLHEFKNFDCPSHGYLMNLHPL